MVLPTVIVEVEDSEVFDTHVIGVVDVAVILVDWDKLDLDPEEAKAMLEEMSDLDLAEPVDAIRTRLKGIIADNEEEEDEIEEDIEDEEEEEDEEEYCDVCGDPGCEGDCEDDDEIDTDL